MLILWGSLLIAAGVALNEWTLAWIYPSGIVISHKSLWLVRGCDVLLITWGIATILLRTRPLLKKLNLALFSLLVFAPLAAELALRLSFQFEKSPTRNPELFANYHSDDDYWRLQMLWKGKVQEAQKEYTHPLLGWSQTKVTPANPFGLDEVSRSALLGDAKKKILFYGDSYVKGMGDVAHQLPRYMSDRMPGTEVVDLGVGGYGTDQSFLLFRETWRLAGGKPFIIMSVLTEDVDRSLLTFRTAPKNVLVASADGSLSPRDASLPSLDEWLEKSPLGIRSYFASFVLTKIRKREYNPHIEEVKVLNAQIIAAVHKIVTDEHLGLLYVIFYGRGFLEFPDWRERLIKDELAKHSIRYLDTREPIEAYCSKTGTPHEDLYFQDGHHNNLGNEVIGNALVECLTGK